MEMTPRERVQKVLNRQVVDRLPADLWLTSEVYDALSEHAGTSDDLEQWKRLRIDRIPWFGAEYAGPMRTDLPEGSIATPFGPILSPAQVGHGVLMEYTDHPLSRIDTVDELDSYPWWPDPAKWDFGKMESMVKRWAPRHFVFGPWVSIFEIYCGMRGLELAMMDLAENPDFVEAACDRIEETQTVLIEGLLTRCAGNLGAIFVSDDMGSQNSLLMSLGTWDYFIGPRLKNWCELAHRHGARVFYHSDGAIRPLIPRLIEARVDVLNPIQHACPGMELEGLHRDFGDHLIFHGGVDTQQVLPKGTPEQVAEETRRCIEALAPNGIGYLPASCHNIQAGTPVENVLAMIDTIHNCKPWMVERAGT